MRMQTGRVINVEVSMGIRQQDESTKYDEARGVAEYENEDAVRLFDRSRCILIGL